MLESTEKVQINFQVSPEDAAAIDALAKQDGYDKRASWIRRVIRREIGNRAATASVTTLPHPEGAQVVPDVSFTFEGENEHRTGDDRRSGDDRRASTQPAQGI